MNKHLKMRKNKALTTTSKDLKKIIKEEKSEVKLNGKALKKGIDYTINEYGDIVLNDTIKAQIKNSSNFSFQSSYYKSVIQKGI